MLCVLRNRRRYAVNATALRRRILSVFVSPIQLRRSAAGDVIQGAGDLRKLRWADKRRGKGKRGGLRVIYFYRAAGGARTCET